MPRRVMQGRIVSDKGDKTVVVLIERKVRNPLYKKYIKSSKRYSAHDEQNLFREGDFVSIEECAPISKRKRWKVVSAPPEGRTPKVIEKKAEEKPVASKKAKAKAKPKTSGKAKKAAAKADSDAAKPTASAEADA